MTLILMADKGQRNSIRYAYCGGAQGAMRFASTHAEEYNVYNSIGLYDISHTGVTIAPGSYLLKSHLTRKLDELGVDHYTIKARNCIVAGRFFYIDIDFKSSKHNTISKAHDAVMGAAEKNVLPCPTDWVFTGGGVHYYWHVEGDNVPVAMWNNINTALRWLCNEAGIDYDKAPGAGGHDHSLVRRPSVYDESYAKQREQFNHKYTPPALISGYNNIISPYIVEELEQRCADTGYPGQLGTLPQPASDNVILLPVIGGGGESMQGTATGATLDVDMPRVALEDLTETCDQIKLTIDKPELSNYNHIFNIISLCKGTHEQAEAAHAICKLDNRYNPSFVDLKWDEVNIEPHRLSSCSSVRDQSPRPELCTRCPHYTDEPNRNAVVATLIAASVAGMPPVEEVCEVIRPDQTTFATLRKHANTDKTDLRVQYARQENEDIVTSFMGVTLPFPYFLSMRHHSIQRVDWERDEDEKVVVSGATDVLCPAFFPMRQSIADMHNTATPFILGLHITASQIRVCALETSGADRLAKSLFALGIPSQTRKAQNLSVNFITEWMTHTSAKFSTAIEHMGHQPDGSFVMMDTVLYPDQTLTWSMLDSDMQAVADNRGGRAGSMDQWREATSEFIGRFATNAQKVQLLTAFMGPLLQYTIGEGGMVFSVYGESQMGKTTAFQFGTSVYGAPATHTVKGDSTAHAMIKHLGQYHSLTAFVDEITTVKPDDLLHIAYTAISGEERARSGSGGVGLHAGARHNTVMATTANVSWHETAGGKAEARRAVIGRVIEVQQPKITRDDKAISRLLATLEAHHGHAWVPYVKLLMATDMSVHKARYQELYDEMHAKLAPVVEGYDQIKYVVQFAAVAQYAIEMMDKAGVLKAELFADVVEDISQQAVRNAGDSVANASLTLETFTSFYERHATSFSVINSEGRLISVGEPSVVTGDTPAGIIDYSTKTLTVRREMVSIAGSENDLGKVSMYHFVTRGLIDGWLIPASGTPIEALEHFESVGSSISNYRRGPHRVVFRRSVGGIISSEVCRLDIREYMSKAYAVGHTA